MSPLPVTQNQRIQSGCRLTRSSAIFLYFSLILRCADSIYWFCSQSLRIRHHEELSSSQQSDKEADSDLLPRLLLIPFLTFNLVLVCSLALPRFSFLSFLISASSVSVNFVPNRRCECLVDEGIGSQGRNLLHVLCHQPLVYPYLHLSLFWPVAGMEKADGRTQASTS